MPRLFVFAIGGTGARVLRSLTMLLAAGVRIPDCEAVVPVLIDPDTQNGNTNDTEALLQLYEKLHDRLGARDGKFFGQPLRRLAKLAANGAATLNDSFVYDFGGINQSFRQYLHYPALNVDTQALVDLLFTKTSLDETLKEGFQGSPNVGSVVLNALVDSDEMRFLALNLQPTDRVFFISSIFGGTGAAGFPLLVENLRKAPDTVLPNLGHRKLVKAGALVMLPYFKLMQPSPAELAKGKKAIDSRTFITKAKDALKYYADHLSGVEATYYLGDQLGTPLHNTPGGHAQLNDARLLEMIGALAIVHFMAQPDTALSQHKPAYHEFGLTDDAQTVTFAHFTDSLRREVARPLIRLRYFARYFLNQAPKDRQESYASAMIPKLPDRLNERAFEELKQFLTEYDKWLAELGTNERRFGALAPVEKDFNEMVEGMPIKPGFPAFLNPGLVYKTFADELNRTSGTDKPVTLPENAALQRVVRYFDEATEKLITDKLRFA